MPKDVFGSPDAHDATAEWDTLVEEAGQEHAAMFKIVKDDLLNRPVGSKKVPLRERETEWKLLREDPQMLLQFFTDQNATLEEAVNYVFEMEEKRK